MAKLPRSVIPGALALALLPAGVGAQPGVSTRHDRPASEVAAVRASGPIQVDGRLDDPAWLDAEIIADFRQREPDEGSPASQTTEVRILYDDAAIYLGASLAGPVTYRLGRRDMPIMDSDWFGVTLDSHHDHSTGFRFQVNPGGVQRDATVRMDRGTEIEDLSWDAVWQVATTATDTGWTVEMRIPFSQLRFSAEPVQTWGLQLVRIIGPRQERAHWSFQPRGQPGGVPTYGHLTGLEGVRPGRRLEALPFLVARGEYLDRSDNPFRGDRDHSLAAGIDFLYRLTSHITINGAINPDFGHVEVDPAVVNLGVYETFFPERRPFFVEGNEIFRFTGNTSGGELFYSRRIGRRPQVPPPGAAADVPDVTPILGAAKLTGQTPDGWAVGLMNAITGRTTARYLDGDIERSARVEPLTNYFVARARRNMNAGRTAVGGIATAVNRDLATDALEHALHDGGYSAGLDFRHEWADRTWAILGSVSGSHVTGSPAAITRTQRMPHHYFQRPDADHLRVDSTATSLTGYSVGARVARQAGQHWTGSLAAAATAPSFEVNDMGFQSRTDRQDLEAALTYSQREPGRFLRDWSTTAYLRHERNFAGDVVQHTRILRAQARSLDHWGGNLLLQHRGRALDDRSTRGGPLRVRPAGLALGGALSSDARRPVVVGINLTRLESREGDTGWEGGATLQLRTSSRWNLAVEPAFTRGRVAAQYLATIPDPSATETFGARYLFAPLDFTEVKTSVRLNLALGPRLTLEMFAQPLIFAFDFDQPMALAAPRTFDHEPWTGPFASLDRTLLSLRGNALLRWEWRPGSTLYVAWQQARLGEGESGRFSLLDDSRALLQTRPDNILVIKVNYWLNP
jgi:hypothetical protein